MTSTILSQKQLNFARFSIVCVDINKHLLEDIFTIFIKPADLDKEIKKCPSLLAGKYKLNPDQRRKCCYNSLNVPDYSKFDITLLYKLITNLCPLLEPTKKWGNKPASNDLDVGDDIERIRNLRNTNFAHPELPEISEDKFKKLWSDEKSMIQRCQQFTTSNGCTTDYNKMLIDLERKTFTVEDYTSSKDIFGAIYVYGEPDVLCGETACFEADISLEEDGNMPVSWDRLNGLVRKEINLADDKYRGSDATTLIINSVCKKDEAGYQAVISRNHDVKILSNKVYLRPKGELPYLKELNATANNKEIYIHYVFKVSDKSPIVKKIKWTKNKSKLEVPSDKYQRGGLADDCFTILRPGEDDKGLYTCTVENAVGPVSKYIKLDVASAKIASTSNSKVICGSDTGFDCIVSGYPSPDAVEWQHSPDGKEFFDIDNDPNKYVRSSSDPCSQSLLLRKATLNQQRYYRVVVSNKIGKCTSNNLFLQVTGSKPNISEVTCSLHGNSVNLKCGVFLYDESPPLDDVYWTKKGTKIDIEKTNGKYSGVDINDPSLTINNVNHNDAGDYQLIAVNAVGETESKLIVLGVPEVLLKNCVEKEDGSLWFTMTIQSVPDPHAVQWSMKKNNSDTFEPLNVNSAEYIGTSIFFPHPVLVIKPYGKLEHCIFQLEVKNRIGEVKRVISGKHFQDELKGEQKTLGKFYTDGGSDIPFSIWLSELAEKFPKEKINQLKLLIQTSCKIEDVKELEKAKTAHDCFKILLKENIVSPSDVIIMQFLLKRTNREDLEKECIKYAKEQNAMHFYEKPPESGHRNVRFHVVRYLQQFSTEDEAKIRKTVSKIVRCSIEEVKVHGFLHSYSFFIVLSIKEIYIERLFAIQQHDKDKLSKLSIDYFKDDYNTVRFERQTEVKDKVKVMIDNPKGITKSSKEDWIANKDGPDAFTVRRLFVFIKENLNFDSLKDEFIRRIFFSDKASKKYVFDAPGEYYRCERFLKYLIRKGRCKEFIACIHEMNFDNNVYGRIRRFQLFEANTAWKVVENKISFSVDDKMLQNHLDVLYTELEPCEIADEMFQASLFTPDDHDYITDNPKRRKRLRNLLEILEKKGMHAHFLVLLKKMGHTLVLETLRTNRQFRHDPYDCADCIRHNFTFLQDELQVKDDATDMIFKELTYSDLSDIRCCKGTIRQISKMIKTLLVKRSNACEDFLRALPVYLKRNDLIPKIKTRSADIRTRGRPVLIQNLSCLTTVCLKDQEGFLYENLEPFVVADLLFEEYNLPVSVHDKITEAKYRRNQIRHLLETLTENTEDSFHSFLDILQRKEEFQFICRHLGYLDKTTVKENLFSRTNISKKHEIVRESGDVQHLPLELKISMPGWTQIEQSLIDSFRSSNADISEAAISIGQMDFSKVTEGPVIIQLRPVTDDADQTLLNAKENTRLFEMIFEILRKVEIARELDNERQLQIRVQIYYSKSQVAKTNYGSFKATMIKQRIRIHKKKLLDELEPAAIVFALSKTNPSLGGELDRVRNARSCNTRIRLLLTLVEEGSPDCVEGFLFTLKKLGYSEIVKLIDPESVDNKAELVDPSTVHVKAENIRKSIALNYKNILDEMQISLAKETLSKCVGDVNEIKEKIYEGGKSRKERMNNFLRLIIHNDHYVIEFAKVLRENGLEELLTYEESIQRKHISAQDIELTFVRESFPLSPEGVLFDSVITLCNGDMVDNTDAWTENINLENLSNLFDSFNIVIPEDPFQMSFTRNLLDTTKLDEFVSEIRLLARRIVLCKHIKDEDKILGTVYVYDVAVKHKENEIDVEEMDPREQLDFFHRKNDNLIKVIRIKGCSPGVSATKSKVYEKYKIFLKFQTIHLHHEMEHYAEVAKLIAHKKIEAYIQFIMSVRNSIPINHIGDIVSNAVNRALSKESITRLCFEAFIQESGNINSEPYVCRSSTTVERLKKELIEKTLESVSGHLGSEICAEMQRHIVSDIKRKFKFDLDPFKKFLDISKLILLQSVLTVIAAIVNPYAGIVVGVVSAVSTIFIAVNVNSEAWRRDVATEIYKKVRKNKQEVVQEVTSSMLKRCKITKDELDNIVGQLETFQRRKDLSDQVLLTT